MNKEMEKLLAQISSPADFFAAAAGGAIGSLGSISIGMLDFGSGAAAGAMAGVSARKAYVAATQKKKLLESIDGLLELYDQEASSTTNENNESSDRSKTSKTRAKVELLRKLINSDVMSIETGYEKLLEYSIVLLEGDSKLDLKKDKSPLKIDKTLK